MTASQEYEPQVCRAVGEVGAGMLGITVTYRVILIKVNGFCAARREGARRRPHLKIGHFVRAHHIY